MVVVDENSEKGAEKCAEHGVLACLHCLHCLPLSVDSKKKKAKANTNNTNNTNNTTNTNNTNTKLLDTPEDKIDKVFYHLFDNGEQPVTELLRISGIASKKSFSVLKSRISDKLVVTRKEGTTSFYNISEQLRQEIQFKINQKAETLTRQKEEKQRQQSQQQTQDETLAECKEFFSINSKKLSGWIDEKTININFNDLVEYSTEFGEILLSRPEEFIQLLELAIEDNEIFTDLRVRIKNIPKDSKISIENIRSKHLDKLISIDGRVASASPVNTKTINIKFECPSCGTIISVMQISKKIKEPSRCSCGRRGGFKDISKEKIDSQTLIIEDIQELTDNPHSQRISAFAEEDLVNKKNVKKFYPGNEIRIVGILKDVPIVSNSGATLTTSTKAIEINSVEPLETEIKVDSFTKEEKIRIREIASEIDVEGMEKITESFAPDIYGYDYIKKAIMLQACNERNKPKMSSVRNKQNILLIGDPGIAKSVLCKFAVDITPGSRKASGGGSSAVGITASVIKEESSMGGYRIEAGALPLAREILFLDEMNNLSDEDKPRLQEAMSEQIITINKANLHLSLRVTAGILATANPISGHFIDTIDYTKQFNIPSPILNRFDVIFAMRDIPNLEKDEAIADVMIKRERGEIETPYSMDEMKKFFAYVRATPNPELTDKIAKQLKKIYSGSRNQETKNLIINPRFMEALARMIKASAKMRLSKVVEEKDIELAIEILSKSHFKISEYEKFNFKNSGDQEEETPTTHELKEQKQLSATPNNSPIDPENEITPEIEKTFGFSQKPKLKKLLNLNKIGGK